MARYRTFVTRDTSESAFVYFEAPNDQDAERFADGMDLTALDYQPDDWAGRPEITSGPERVDEDGRSA